MPDISGIRQSMKRIGITILSFAFVCGIAHASSTGLATLALAQRDGLQLIAYDGMCSYFRGAPYKQLSPSTTDVGIWKTCWAQVGGFHGLGSTHRSAIYKIRLDCASKKYAILDWAFYEDQFWDGPRVPASSPPNPPWWKPLSKTFQALRDICEKHPYASFDGPNSKASL